ncbi:MAG TPA: tRNA-intron lyase [Methanomassiliicoccales archaeon]|nr:tRNA-intron lyase [Methanomassiliicoccales archaeon]
MPGELEGESVVVADQAEGSQIYNKGFYGYPRSGGGLELDLLEALYLLESDRLKVLDQGRPVDNLELIRRAGKAVQDFEIRYIVYRDLRQRGYIVKADAGDFDFRVYPRGGTPTTSQTKHWVNAVSERAAFRIRDMLRLSETSQRTRKELMLAVVDEEGDITYYQSSKADPKGRSEDAVGDGSVEGFMIKDRVMVPLEAGKALHEHGFYGKQIGRVLQLSLIETAHLMKMGRVEVPAKGTSKRMQLSAFKKKAEEIQPDFELRLRAYDDMRSRRLVVKTGFKYGTHFRVYDGDPESHHSRYLVHAVPGGYEATWPEISRAVRLAHGVKKDILIATVTSRDVEYVRLRRVRP